MTDPDIYGDTEYRRVSLLLALYAWLLLGLVWSDPAINTYFPGNATILVWTTGVKAAFSAAVVLVLLGWLLWPRFDPKGFLLDEVEEDRVRTTVAAKGKHLAGGYGAFLGVLLATVILDTFPELVAAGIYTTGVKLVVAMLFLFAGLAGSHYFVDTYAGAIED